MWDAERVDLWTVGLVALVVVGLGAIVFGALWDRSRNRRRAAEMLAPPPRPIPRLDPTAPGPRYVSELQARRRPEHGRADRGRPGPGSQADRERVSAQLSTAAVTLATGYASKDFVTDPEAGRAVLDAPRILVCDDEVASIRELLATLELLIPTQTPLVLVAPAIEATVRATLEVNAIRGTLPLLVVVVTDPTQRARVAAESGATPSTRGDRQAGYLPPEQLGHLGRWVSTHQQSFLIAAVAPQVG